MKINITNGVVVATSETKKEALALIAFALGDDTTATNVSEVKRHYNVSKPCELCGEKFKGARSMSLHKAMRHKVYSANYEKNKEYYAKKKMMKGGLLGDITQK